MGRGLAARYPVFAREVERAAVAVHQAGGARVWTSGLGFGDHPSAEILFCYQIALANLLRANNIRVGGVLGYGAGAVAAAVVSGALSLTDGARVAVTRGRAMARPDAAAARLTATREQVARLL